MGSRMGALERWQLSSQACRMLMKVKGLRRPMRTTFNGHDCVLYTTGYVAHVLNRTPWCIAHWQRIGLFPKSGSPSIQVIARRSAGYGQSRFYGP